MHYPFTSKKMHRAAALIALAAAGILVASACSSGSSGSASATGARPTYAPPAASNQLPATPPSPKSSPVTIKAGSSSLGPIVVDAAGLTLYRYDKDTPGSGTSACSGACAAAWPPALVNGQASAGPGLTGMLGLVTRADGTHQVALDGHPLYRFSGDQNPGDTAGDGFGGIWHVVHTSASSATTSASPAVSSGSRTTASSPVGNQPPATTASSTSNNPSPAMTAPPPSSPATIAVGSSSLGPIVVDGAGHTLYRYDHDTPGSGTSTCNAACATAWPPALVAGTATAGPGVPGTVGMITRADGTHQITLDGHPLYRFSGDQGPGDTTGNGFGGIWHVVSASAVPPASTPTANTPPSSIPPATMTPWPGY